MLDLGEIAAQRIVGQGAVGAERRQRFAQAFGRVARPCIGRCEVRAQLAVALRRVEQRLLKALGWLKARTGSTGGKIRTIAAALLSSGARDDAALERMALSAPKGAGEWLQARLLRHALAKTRPPANP